MKNTFILLILFVAACTNPAPNTQGKLSMLEMDHKWVVVDEQKTVLYDVFLYDNGPDAPADGLYRIVKDGKIGYADESTNAIVIEPQYDCAYPFENGKAKVSTNCKTVKDGEYDVWESDAWQFINKTGGQ
ncbi:WG repeat-containing protein [Haliscomenobacter sp.]|uniref:WG repeat-containing protein n=1 Tax=Haliscomenobacter sp. TaxID=2717303 RepID=UPI0035940A86